MVNLGIAKDYAIYMSSQKDEQVSHHINSACNWPTKVD